MYLWSFCGWKCMISFHTGLFFFSSPHLILSPPPSSFLFSPPVNEIMKHNVADYNNKSVAKLTLPERLFAGACAGLSYWVGTFPLDAIKVRQEDSVVVWVILLSTSMCDDYLDCLAVIWFPLCCRHIFWPENFLFTFWYLFSFPLVYVQARVQALPYEQRQGWFKTAAIIYREGEERFVMKM